jgi:hypothetical protein
MSSGVPTRSSSQSVAAPARATSRLRGWCWLTPCPPPSSHNLTRSLGKRTRACRRLLLHKGVGRCLGARRVTGESPAREVDVGWRELASSRSPPAMDRVLGLTASNRYFVRCGRTATGSSVADRTGDDRRCRLARRGRKPRPRRPVVLDGVSPVRDQRRHGEDPDPTPRCNRPVAR